MSMRKQSPYGPFVKRVLLPAFRIGLLLVVLLCIVFGSWLETNDSMGNCSFKNSMSFHQVYLYRNISNSNLTTPDSVSFGLWKSCYFYALNCSCTPTNLQYQPDIQHILQVATKNNAKPPLNGTDATSLIRLIPLLISTVLIGIAFFLGLFWANRRGKFIYRNTICGFIALSMLLISYVFGSTYHSYFNAIKKTCKDPSNSIYCARHAVGSEVIIFSITITLLIVTFVSWFLVSSFFKQQQQSEEEQDEYDGSWNFFRTLRMFRMKSVSSSASSDVTIAEEKEIEKKDQLIEHWSATTTTTNQMPMLQQYHQQQQQQKKQFTNHNNYSYSDTHKPRPERYSKRYSQKSLPSSNNSSPKPCRSKRKSSHDSTFTFGQHKRKSNRISDIEPAYYTPTTASPQALLYQEMIRNSFCMTPYYQEDGSSNSSGSSDTYIEQQKMYKVPILSMPPKKHPLSKKVITDKRIQNYLQQQT